MSQDFEVFLYVTLHPLHVHQQGVELCNIERLDLTGGYQYESVLVVLTSIDADTCACAKVRLHCTVFYKQTI